MIKQRSILVIYFIILLLVAINLLPLSIAHSGEFEIDEIITAIKNYI